MSEVCDLCGPTIGRVALYDVGDDRLLLCDDCTERVPARPPEWERGI